MLIQRNAVYLTRERLGRMKEWLKNEKRYHVVLKGNRGGINRLEQSVMVDYGKLISNGRRGGGEERKGGSLEYSRTSWEGFGKFHFITLSF